MSSLSPDECVTAAFFIIRESDLLHLSALPHVNIYKVFFAAGNQIATHVFYIPRQLNTSPRYFFFCLLESCSREK